MANAQFLHRIKASACRAILVLMAAGSVNAWAGGDDKDANSSVLAAPVTPQEPPARAESELRLAYTRSPLSFEANQGQTDERVKFLARGRGYTLFLTAAEAVLALRASSNQDKDSAAEATEEAVLRLQFLGANPTPTIFGQEKRVAQVNYFHGNDSKRWRTHVPLYARVRYKNLYPDIDLVYYGNQQRLEYDFVLAPGAEPERIRLRYAGADRLRLDADGNLILQVAGREVTQRAPRIYQDIDGQRQAIAGNYVITGTNQVGFALAPYDAGQPLIIDPILEYSTYLGGSGHDRGTDIAVDASGNVYVTGGTTSVDFPLANPLQSINAGGDVFVSKFEPSGRTLIYSTYLGGGSHDMAAGIAIDASGNAYIAGVTRSDDFPTVNPYQAEKAGWRNIFITKLNAAGSALIYSTYLGGSGDNNAAGGIAVDTDGNAYVTGTTISPDFPMASPIQAVLAGNQDAFVTKLDASGTRLVYSTYLGGRDHDRGADIAVDGVGNAYLIGSTESADFPMAGPIQASLGGGFDAVVAKINAAGSMLVYSTYLGGDAHDWGHSIAVDSGGNAYVTGYAYSSNFPWVNRIEGLRGTIFATKVNAAGSALAYSSPLGDGWGWGIAVDAAGSAYVTGRTESLNFPLASPFQLRFAGIYSYDAFVLKMNPAGSALVYSSYLGGQGSDSGTSIAVDAEGSAYVTGGTYSNDFPTVNALQSSRTARAGSSDAFVTKVKLDPTTSADLSISMTHWPEPAIAGDDLTYSLSVTNNGPDDAREVLLTDILPGDAAFVSATPNQGTCSGSSTISCQLGMLINGAGATVDIVVTPNAGGTLDNLAYVTSAVTDPDSNNNVVAQRTAVAPAADLAVFMTARRQDLLTYSITVTNNGPDVATDVIVRDELPADVRLSSASASQGSCSGTSTITCSLGTLGIAATATVRIVVIPVVATTFTNKTSVTSSAPLDPNVSNNTASAVTTVTLADFALTMQISPDPAVAGSKLTYTFTISNNDTVARYVELWTHASLSQEFASIWASSGRCYRVDNSKEYLDIHGNIRTSYYPLEFNCNFWVLPGDDTTVILTTEADADPAIISAARISYVGGTRSVSATTAVSPSYGGGGGCTLKPDAGVDPLLPLLVVLSGLYLLRRRVNMH